MNFSIITLCTLKMYDSTLYTISVQDVMIIEFVVITKPQKTSSAAIILIKRLFQQFHCPLVDLLLDKLQTLAVEIIS